MNYITYRWDLQTIARVKIQADIKVVWLQEDDLILTKSLHESESTWIRII